MKDNEREICDCCNKEIDKEVCWCGQPVDEHGYYDNHGFIPMGCECYMEKNNRSVEDILDKYQNKA